jgi:hypothetical protein
LRQTLRSKYHDATAPNDFRDATCRHSTVAAVLIAAYAIIFTVWTVRERRNADLVKIGVSVLRVDPEKESKLARVNGRLNSSTPTRAV